MDSYRGLRYSPKQPVSCKKIPVLPARLPLMKVGIPYEDIKAVTLDGVPPRLSATINGQADFTIVSEGEKLQGEKPVSK